MRHLSSLFSGEWRAIITVAEIGVMFSWQVKLFRLIFRDWLLDHRNICSKIGHDDAFNSCPDAAPVFPRWVSWESPCNLGYWRLARKREKGVRNLVKNYSENILVIFLYQVNIAATIHHQRSFFQFQTIFQNVLSSIGKPESPTILSPLLYPSLSDMAVIH